MRLGASTFLLALVATLVVGCGSSSSSATPTARAAPGSSASAPTGPAAGTAPATAPTQSPEDSGDSGASGGSAVDTSLPSIVEGAWNTGTGHVDITGDRTVSFDVVGGAFGSGGFAIVTLADQADSYGVQFSISNKESSGVSISGPGLITGGSWGAECSLTITSNQAANLAGNFSCPNADGADTIKNVSLKLNVKGTFALTP